jgi:hypothetical protein
MTDFGYHPAVVAQKAATMQILSGGRFRLGLGAGENLNEHVVGKRWPAVGEEHQDAFIGWPRPSCSPRCGRSEQRLTARSPRD